MISTSLKIETARRALAEGWIRLSEEALKRMASNDLPKPDVLATARAAAVLAAKKTPDLIPYCHPIPLDHVRVNFEAGAGRVRVEAEVLCVAKTGVEMEALCAVNTALLVIYDMLKCVDKDMEIGGIRLLEKDGGKSDYPVRLKQGFRAAVVISSDRCSKGLAEDKTGPWLLEKLAGFGVAETQHHLLPDEPLQMQALLEKLCAEGVDLVLTSGGTGLSPRDRTVEAVSKVIEREIPGAMEAARAFGQKRTPYAMLSRGIAGQKGKTLIVTLPGSSAGVRESMAALYPYLFHAHSIMAQGLEAKV
ncbi:MAG: bifunctional molybdenum cofactor biosynthesis protein MoaC/MoaB [candidate division FCPU426 bacterium]